MLVLSALSALAALVGPVVFAAGASTTPVSIPPGWEARERAVAAGITAPSILGRVRFLAHDLLEGRGPAARGGELAMLYIAAEYERMGLRPVGDGFIHRFDIVGLTTTVKDKLVVSGAGGALALAPPDEVVVSSGTQSPRTQLRDAEIVFCGYGITAPEQRWDDYKDVDVRGKVLLVMNDDPSSDPSLFAGKTRLYYGRWSYKYEEAARRGAAAVIIIHTDASAGYPWQVVRSGGTGEDFELPQGDEARLAAKLWATEDAARRMVRLGGQELDELRRRAEGRDFRPVALGVKLSVTLETAVRKLQTGNVLGVVQGEGALAGEMVVVTAHHDHLGLRDPVNGDGIMNGAFDNATGVAGMLAIAEAMTRAPASKKARRSVLFAATGVEESGLLGSAQLAAHPPVPAGRLAAAFNLDGLNVWGRSRDVEVIGLGKSTLDEVVGGVARAQGRRLVPDQNPDRGRFYRSDQFSLAKIGVPAMRLDAGVDFVGREPGWGKKVRDEYVAKRYHQASDELDASWNLDGALDDLRLVSTAILRVAGTSRLPAWRHGEEFEGPRKRSLEQR